MADEMNYTEQEVKELMVLARMFPKTNVEELIRTRAESDDDQ